MNPKWPPRSIDADVADPAEPTPDALLSPSEVYHENSKLRPHDASLYSWIAFVNASAEIRHVITHPSSGYLGYPSVALPRDSEPLTAPFEAVVMGRHSVREFSGGPLRLAQLARILSLGDGVVRAQEAADGSTWSLRTAPSAGGLYPIELYCVVREVTSLEPGLYFYSALHHRLDRLIEGDLTPDLVATMPASEPSIRTSAVSIVLAAVMPRIKFKYGERAYRFALLEAGHIAQNLLLAAHAAGLGAVPIGGFVDDRLNRLLRLDGVEEIALYVVPVGCLR